MLPIDKNVPFPEPRKKARVYPLLEMEVGDSFFFPVPAEPTFTFAHRRANRQKRIASVLRSPRVRAIGTFVARQVDDGVRVWRTA